MTTLEFLIAAGAWAVLCFRRPGLALPVLLALYLLIYFRFFSPLYIASTQLYGVDIFAAIFLLFRLRAIVGVFASGALRHPLLVLVLPFPLLTIVLPFLGIGFFGFEPRYATPAFRLVQSLLVGLAAVGLFTNTRRSVNTLIAVLCVVSCGHFVYSCIQYGFYLGLLDRSWVALDDALLFNNVIFSYPRVTGLLVNPNSYGVLCAVLVAIGFGLLPVRDPFARRAGALLIASSIPPILMSGSRSGMLCVVAAGVAVILLQSRRFGLRGARKALMAIMVCAIPLVVVYANSTDFRFEAIWERLETSRASAQGGNLGSDESLAARYRLWADAIEYAREVSFFGTFVDPAYLLAQPVDSHYVVTLSQGGIIYLSAFILFLAGMIFIARECVGGDPSSIHALTFLSTSVALAVSSLVQSSIAEPPYQVLLYSMAAASISTRWRPRPLRARARMPAPAAVPASHG